MHLLQYLVYCKEFCPSTGLAHYQGYVEFTKPYTLIYIKSIFKDKTIHLEHARESRACNRAYCLKGLFLEESLEYTKDPVKEELNFSP